MFSVQNITSLIEGGNSEQWAIAAPKILAAPGGKVALVDSVRQVMADRASRSVKDLGAFFENNVRPGIEATHLMSKTDLDVFGARLSAIENMKIPEERKLGLARGFILQTFGGYAASLGARAGTSNYTSLVDLIPR